MLQRLLGTRTFNAALDTLRQIELASFDFELHANFDPAVGARVAETLAAVRQRRVAVVPAAPFNRMPCELRAHLCRRLRGGLLQLQMGGGIWRPMPSRLSKRPVCSTHATATRFRDSILARGGSLDAMEAFVKFRGRQPDVRPLLKQTGIAA